MFLANRAVLQRLALISILMFLGVFISGASAPECLDCNDHAGACSCACHDVAPPHIQTVALTPPCTTKVISRDACFHVGVIPSDIFRPPIA